MLFAILLFFLVGYLLFVCFKIGIFERVPLAWGPMSLDKIPDRAALKYRHSPLFTADSVTSWRIPQLEPLYPPDSSWSALRIRDTIDILSTVLRSRMVPGDRVAICKTNHLDIHFLMQAIIRAGGTACPINNKFLAHDVEPYLNHLDCRVLLSDCATLSRIIREGGRLGEVTTVILAETPDNSPMQEATLHLLGNQAEIEVLFLGKEAEKISKPLPAIKRQPDDLLYLVHSSGTTGFPKAVMLKNGPQSHAVRGLLLYAHVSRRFDKGYFALPNNHQAVILTFNGALLLGLPIHWSSAYDQFTFDAHQTMQELATHGFTGFFGFPVVYTLLKEIPLATYPNSKMCIWAATADASHEAIQRHFVQQGHFFKRLGIPLAGSIYMDVQGSSEVGAPSVLRYITPFTKKFARRVGRPGFTPLGPKIRIRTADGRLARVGETGKLEVKGKTVFPGYWKNPELTTASFTDGWFFTGDAARYSPDGHVVQLDRWVDVIHTAYGDVYSLLIEEKIHKHPAIFDACVYGYKQIDGSELPAIAVALRPGFNLSPEIMRKELNSLLLPEEQLYRCELRNWLDFPIGVTGKTLKRTFREQSAVTKSDILSICL